MCAAAALELCAISKRFGKIVANDAIDLSVARGEIRALVGANGAGKTTLMHILYGLLSPDSGVIRIDGKDADSVCRTRRTMVPTRRGFQYCIGGSAAAGRVCRRSR
jgi:ABC-type uncharacterized transport system ATPase subunit